MSNETYASIARKINNLSGELSDLAKEVGRLSSEIDALYREYFRTDRESAKTAILQEVARLEAQKRALHKRNFEILDEQDELHAELHEMRAEDMMYACADY